MDPLQSKTFIRLSILTIIFTYLVILAGAVVRTTQSGMGCPDWPKCFGRWIPPTCECQLPDNYREIYKDAYTDTTFNVFHTWTEYVNRLTGALLGLTIFAMLVASFHFWKTDRKMVWLTLLAFVMVGFQGWLGAKVVSSNLAPFKITIHMLTALILLALLIYILYKAKPSMYSGQISNPVLKLWIGVAIVFTLLQVLFGTQVRQQIDEIAKGLAFEQRNLWIGRLSGVFNFHKFISWLVLGINCWLAFLVFGNYKAGASLKIKNAVKAILALIAFEIILGFIMAFGSIPAAAQPAHMLLSALLFGLQYHLFLSVRK
jgi:cytochrome c oxidase assembly protein subunit 15